ncbi:MAG: hypothetical protein HGA19_06485 [Oscillochloris sp.]|nr:hypothetical protein [Oscillochloris sp.]
MVHLSQIPITTLAVIGSYLPRQCGIATYTADLGVAIAQTLPTTEGFALVVNDRAAGYAHPERITGYDFWMAEFHHAFDGFLGRNARPWGGAR